MGTNLTVDDHSPMIHFEPRDAWFSGNGPSDVDEAVLRYSSRTFMACRTVKCAATFQFSGTAVFVFGAKRDNHGQYQVTLDGKTHPSDGHGRPELFHTLLFSAISLPNGVHTLILSNVEDGLYLDLDEIIWTTAANIDPPKQYRVLHSNPSLIRNPALAWEQLARGTDKSFDGSVLTTNVSNASLSLDFFGVFIEVFGQVDVDAGNYQVQIDDQKPVSFSASWDQFAQQARLFYVDDLAHGPHKLIIVNVPTTSGNRLYIEYIMVSSESTDDLTTSVRQSGPTHTSIHEFKSVERSSTPSVSSSSSIPTVEGTTSYNSPKPSLNSGLITAIAVGAASFVIIISSAAFWLWKRTQLRVTLPESKIPPAPQLPRPNHAQYWTPSQICSDPRFTAISGSNFALASTSSHTGEDTEYATTLPSRVVRVNDLRQLWAEKRRQANVQPVPSTSYAPGQAHQSTRLDMELKSNYVPKTMSP